MTITNDERREVAANLREDGNLRTFAETVGFSWEDETDWRWHDVAVKYADLIEPEEQTCHIDRRVPDAPFCSECAYDWDDDWNFCPNCGCKAINQNMSLKGLKYEVRKVRD